MTDLETK